MYYIVQMQFPNGVTVTRSIPALNANAAIARMHTDYPAATSIEVIGSHE